MILVRTKGGKKMKKQTKRYAESAKLLEAGKQYDIKEAIEVIEKNAKSKI